MRVISVSLVTAVIVIVATGCASMPPAKPIQDVRALEGTWQGTVYPVAAQSWSATIVIKSDGTYETTSSRGPVATGKVVRISDGKAFYQSSRGVNGTMTLHEGDGRRVLELRADDGLTAQLTRAQ